MEKYPKIQTVYLRDPDNRYKTLLYGQFALPEFEYLAENEWIWTEKIDGTNIRIEWDGTHVQFAGRTERSETPNFLLTHLQELFPRRAFTKSYPNTPMILYGEGFGAKIQSGGDYIPDGVSFILFDIRIDNWLERENVEDIAYNLGIAVVPIIGRGTLTQAFELAKVGFYSQISSNKRMAEGLVMRPEVELASRTGGRIITKIKYKDFRR